MVKRPLHQSQYHGDLLEGHKPGEQRPAGSDAVICSKMMMVWMRGSWDEENWVFGMSDQPVMTWMGED